MGTKICKCCNINKSLNEYHTNKEGKHGVNSKCKECVKIYYLINRESKIKKSKEYIESNREKYLQYQKEYRIKNKESINLRERNTDRSEWRKKYYTENKERINKQKVEYHKLRRENDETFKLKTNIKRLIRKSFTKENHKKDSYTAEILGCSINEFKQHLESKFESWMSWGNYAKYNGELNYGWDIDHIIPLSSAKSKEDIVRLNHYTNLQPLCSYTNRYIKKNNID